MAVIPASHVGDTSSNLVAGIESFMVIVAQMGEHRIVAPKVVSSSLISHPYRRLLERHQRPDLHSGQAGSTPVPSSKEIGIYFLYQLNRGVITGTWHLVMWS